ncbi:aldehyde dehydrogenase family protein [Achromobacter insolitus]|uniref:aldehyde dehydrogenase family protein n=1 Tax=Achromobacter insolitus TaxID=217204 RepID=UPI0028AAE596|nr:aldehyde dehydrogenase family protein [Achromobacter insolitus]
MEYTQTYIDGCWQAATGAATSDVVDSYAETRFAVLHTSSAADVDQAVAAARNALPGWTALPAAQRASLMRAVANALEARADTLADAIMRETGMPAKLVKRIQVAAPISAWRRYADLCEHVTVESRIGHSIVRRVPTGVVACITPWNYPLHQVTAKVAAALAAGCTVVLKPSEIAPLSAFLLAEAIAEAHLPAGVFNLVHGPGPETGQALARHAGIDMVSFTGSTRAGREIAAAAGSGLKRVSLELGGKSAAIALPGADLATAVKATLASCFLNSGQTCSAYTRLLVPAGDYAKACELASQYIGAYVMGDPADAATRLGPLASAQQRQRVQAMLQQALAAGARIVAGGPDACPVPQRGYFVAPTVLGAVTPDAAIAQEEVFGPVLALLPYQDTAQAIAIANGTPYGLAAAIWGATAEHAYDVARHLRAGQVEINGAPFNPDAPFGGFGQSGMGRENGPHGLEEFTETISYQLPPDYPGLQQPSA